MLTTAIVMMWWCILLHQNMSGGSVCPNTFRLTNRVVSSEVLLFYVVYTFLVWAFISDPFVNNSRTMLVYVSLIGCLLYFPLVLFPSHTLSFAFYHINDSERFDGQLGQVSSASAIFSVQHSVTMAYEDSTSLVSTVDILSGDREHSHSIGRCVLCTREGDIYWMWRRSGDGTRTVSVYGGSGGYAAIAPYVNEVRWIIHSNKHHSYHITFT